MAQPTIRRWRRIIHSKMIFKIILGILILVFLLTMFISIKFCVHSLPSNSDESFYIIRHSLSENRWLVIGDQTGLFSKNTIPELVIRPKNIFFGFEKIVSVDLLYILDSSTTFIVRGKTTADEFLDERFNGEKVEVRCYTIDCTSWDILGKVHTSNWLRSIFPRNYLNIWDYKWFDNLRDHLFGYLDGETNF